MRILWFVNIPFPEVRMHLGMPISGSGWWMTSLAQILAARNSVDLAIVWASPRFEEVVRIKADNILFYCIPEEWHADLRFRNPVSLKACDSVITEFHPDIIEIHGTERYYGLVSRQTNVPIVVSIQGIISEIIKACRGGVSYFNMLRFREILLTFISYIVRSRQEKRIITSNIAFIGRTSWDKDFVLKLNQSARYYHCDEILRNRFENEKWLIEKRSQHPVIVVTSAAKPVKGVDVVLKALKALLEMGASAKTNIFGNFPETGYSGWLRKLPEKLGVANFVDFRGYKNAEQLIEEYKKAWLYVIPSRMENSSNSLAEAQLFGIPVIASDAGGTHSLVDDGVNGLLFKSENYVDLAEKIKLILRDDTLAEKISSSGRRTALLRHDRNSIVTRRLEIYEKEIAFNNLQN